MAAILEPVRPETEEPCADTLEPVATTPVVEDALPLELMTWPALKRMARQYNLKLNVKKPVLIRQIREARAAAVKKQKLQELLRGWHKTTRLAVRKCVALARVWFASARAGSASVRKWFASTQAWFWDWWRSDQQNEVDPKSPAPDQAGLSHFTKIAVCVGGILVGGVAAVIVALI